MRKSDPLGCASQTLPLLLPTRSLQERRAGAPAFPVDAWMMIREVFPRLRTFYNNIDMGAFHGQQRIDRVLGAETYHTRAFPLDDTK